MNEPRIVFSSIGIERMATNLYAESIVSNWAGHPKFEELRPELQEYWRGQAKDKLGPWVEYFNISL